MDSTIDLFQTSLMGNFPLSKIGSKPPHVQVCVVCTYKGTGQLSQG